MENQCEAGVVGVEVWTHTSSFTREVLLEEILRNVKKIQTVG